jgi:hypothetical protein
MRIGSGSSLFDKCGSGSKIQVNFFPTANKIWCFRTIVYTIIVSNLLLHTASLTSRMNYTVLQSPVILIRLRIRVIRQGRVTRLRPRLRNTGITGICLMTSFFYYFRQILHLLAPDLDPGAIQMRICIWNTGLRNDLGSFIIAYAVKLKYGRCYPLEILQSNSGQPYFI